MQRDEGFIAIMRMEVGEIVSNGINNELYIRECDDCHDTSFDQTKAIFSS